MGTVLSVIGAVLLKLLWFLLLFILIILVLVCLILILPICYKGQLEYQETLTVKGKVSWLCGLVSVVVSYEEEEFASRIRVFGMDLQKLLQRLEKHRQKKEERQSTKAEKQSAKGEKQSMSEPVEREDLQACQQLNPEEEINSEQEKPVQQEDLQARQQLNPEEEIEPEQEKPVQQEDLQICQQAEQEKEESGDEESFRDWQTEEDTVMEDEQEKKWYQSLLLKIRLRLKRYKASIAYRIGQMKTFFTNLWSVFKTIREKIQWASKLKEFWQLENTRRMVCILKDNVIHLWRKLKPRVLRGKVIFGAGDPCTTGEILGVAAMLYAAYGKGVQVVPDFETETIRLEGNLLVKGRISIITILIILIRIFLSKEWNQFRREAEQLKEAL